MSFEYTDLFLQSCSDYFGCFSFTTFNCLIVDHIFWQFRDPANVKTS